MTPGDGGLNGRREGDVEVGFLSKVALFGVLVTALVLVVMYGLVRFVGRDEESRDSSGASHAAEPAPFVGPHLQTSPPQDLQEILASERAILSSYGWIDEDQGVVRIPIDRAMDLLVERGLPYAGDGVTEP